MYVCTYVYTYMVLYVFKSVQYLNMNYFTSYAQLPLVWISVL